MAHNGGVYALFVGWQECPGTTPWALYNIMDPSGVTDRHGSTVSAETLRKLHIQVPFTMKFEVWKVSHV